MKKNSLPIIKLENIWKIYKMGEIEVPALKDISLEIYENEFVAIIGSSGSGKSTMMNIIGSLDKPSKGNMYLDKTNINELSESDLSTHRGKTVGFIFQQYNLITSLNAFNNVKLPLEFQEYTDTEADVQVHKVLDSLKLSDKKNNLPSQLSGGQQQRVSIARCLVTNPKVILADEPTGALDSVTGKEVLETLTRLWSEDKKTIIMITHDLNLAKYASRVVELKDGEIVKEYSNKHVTKIK
jgi:putative ABC transport system ATP-binding protein